MTELTAQSPFVTRFRAYLAERFPLAAHGILIVSYYSSNQFLAQAIARPDEPLRYGFHSVLGAVTLFGMFFLLRVFDEHKDFADDVRFHPERVLSRGLISLGHLKCAGALALVVGAALSLAAGPAAFAAWLLALGFSFLMLKEFFCRAWLKRHFLLYSVSHMLIMPLFALLVYSVTTGRYPWTAPPLFWVYAFVGFWVTFNWEISRKIRPPGHEIRGLDSYSALWGPFGAAYAVLAIRVIDTLMVSYVGWRLGLSPWFYGVLVALFCVCLTGLVQFRRIPNARTAKRMETYAGFYIVAFDLTLAIELIRKLGVTL